VMASSMWYLVQRVRSLNGKVEYFVNRERLGGDAVLERFAFEHRSDAIAPSGSLAPPTYS
jgi:hypothetical protein